MAGEELWVLAFIVIVVVTAVAVWLRTDRIARKVRGAVQKGDEWVSGQIPLHDRNFYVLVHTTSFVVVAVSYVFIILPWVGPQFWVLATSLSAYGVSFSFNLVERWYDRSLRRTRRTKLGDFPEVPWISNFLVFHKKYVAGDSITGTVTPLQEQDFVTSSTGDLEHWITSTGHRTHPIFVSPKLPELPEGKTVSGARTVSGVWRGSQHFVPAKPHLYLLGAPEWVRLTDDPAIQKVLLALDPDVRCFIKEHYTWAKPTTLVLMAHDLLASWKKEIAGPQPVLANVEADLEDARRQADHYKTEYEEALHMGKLSRSSREDGRP